MDAGIGVCGTAPDGCGGTLDCGTCPSGDVCSSNQCCPAGTVWNSQRGECWKTKTSCAPTDQACLCRAAGGQWNGKECV
jgi:hypothetical protein